MIVDNIRLPVDVERGAQGGPGFRTSITTLASGGEVANQEWAVARGEWNIGYGVRDRETLEEVLRFFYGRRGRARGFRFKDWLDYKATAELVGTTGNDLTRQLQKTYADTINPFVRKIVYPVADTVQVYVNNLLTTEYVLNANGILAFASDPGANVKATFEFDVPARFDTDNLSVALEWVNAGAIPTIPVVELKA